MGYHPLGQKESDMTEKFTHTHICVGIHIQMHYYSDKEIQLEARMSGSNSVLPI